MQNHVGAGDVVAVWTSPEQKQWARRTFFWVTPLKWGIFVSWRTCYKTRHLKSWHARRNKSKTALDKHHQWNIWRLMNRAVVGISHVSSTFTVFLFNLVMLLNISNVPTDYIFIGALIIAIEVILTIMWILCCSSKRKQ